MNEGNRSIENIRKGVNWIWGSLGFALLYWILESIRDVIAFQKGTFLQRLFFPDVMSFWMRLLVVCILVLFGIYAQSVRNRMQKRTEGRSRLFSGNTIIEAGFGFSLLYWILESVRNLLLSRQGTLFERVFKWDPMIFWMRLLAVLVLLLFSMYIQSLLNDRKRFEQTRDYRALFQSLIADISARFINLASEEIDKSIQQSIGELGRFAQADRSRVVLFSSRNKQLKVSHVWCDDPKKDRNQDLPFGKCPWWMERLRDLNPIHVPSVADLPREAAVAKKLFESESIQSLLAVPILRAGSLLGYLEFDSIRGLKSWSGDTIGFLQIGADIVAHAFERKRVEEALRESEKRYRQLVENANDIIYETDSDGYFTFVNPVAEKILGYSEKEFIGKHFLEIVSPEYRSEAERFYKWQLLKEVPNTYNEFPVLTKDDTVLFLGQNVRLVKEEGNFIGFQAVARDITERLQADEVKQEADSKVRKLDSLQNNFLSTISHELRTPLAVMREGVSLCLDGIAGKLTAKQKDLLSDVITNTDRLTILITDLLDMSRIEGGGDRLQRSPVDLSDIVKKIKKEHFRKADEKSIHIQTIIPGMMHKLYADTDKIVQIFNHLVGNAIRFTGEGGKITIQAEEKDGFFECSVSDTGIGIAVENISKLFVKFQQFNREDGPGYKGTGVGLAIVKALIAKHEGKIWVESAVGKGTTFWFTLKKVPFPKILIVDDEKELVEVIKGVLSADQYRFIESYNGEDAVRLAKKEHPSLILLDMNLPGMSGYEVIGRLKQDARTKDIRILIITGYVVDEEELGKVKDNVAIPIMSKPFKPMRFRNRVRELLIE
jgi:PAS domain S-box-containing protein